MKVATQFDPIPGVNGLTIARKGNARMGALSLRNKKVCLISPLSGLHDVQPNQPVAYLLAPNHYHNKALSAFSDAYPRAQVVATKKATPRLETQTGLVIKSLAGLRKQLPAGYELIEPEGLKTGEVWIRFPVGKQIGWFVIDAFCGKKMTATTSTCKQPELLGTFSSFGVACAETYREWMLEKIDEDQPVLVVPCHGSVINGAGLPAKLAKLVKSL